MEEILFVSERIGSVLLDLSYYEGIDLYSDGDIEDKILEFVKTNPATAYDSFIDVQRNWAVLYHFSYLRENIISGIEILKSHQVLEIGAGMGALTGKLGKLAGSVDCVELSKRRSEINALRHKGHENVKIYVGNYKIIEKFLPEYDIITLIGVFEYAASYIGTNNPYKDFLSTVIKHLKIGGRLYIGVENRLGLKYFAGCKEDHVGEVFEGIEGYPNKNWVKTFSREELESLFVSCGIRDYRFMYPYPDYKFPLHIFSDDYLPQVGDLNMNLMNMDMPRYMLFNEASVYDSFVGTKLFSVFSNSFLIEIIRL